MIADSGRTLSSILECSGGNLPFEFIRRRPSLPCSGIHIENLVVVA